MIKLFRRKPRPTTQVPNWTFTRVEQSLADSQRDFEEGSAAWRTDNRQDHVIPMEGS